MSRLADQPGQDGDDDCFSLGVEVFPDVLRLRRAFRFGPKGELARHVFSPPWSELKVLALKHRAYGEESQLFYVHGGDERDLRSRPMEFARHRGKKFGLSC